MSTNTYQPSNVQLGGARLSTSMLSKWGLCRSEWYYTYLAPHPDVPDSAGLTTSTSPAADLGKDIHLGLEAYRLSGWRDGADTGEYDLDLAISTFEQALGVREDADGFPDDLVIEEQREIGRRMLRSYHEERPGGLLDWRLMAGLEGEPLVEREYAIPLLGGRFLYTVKTDAMGMREWPAKVVRAIDYKTKSYRYLGDFLRATPLLGQGWGEVAVLHTFFPHLPIDGMQYELLIKDRGRQSSLPVVEVAEVGVTLAQAARWLRNVERWALEIAWSVAAYNDKLAKGMDPYEAGMEVFPTSGQLQESNACARFGRTCDFAKVCEDFDDRGAIATIAGMEARSLVADEG